MNHAVIVWLLTISAGGDGPHTVLIPPSPASIHESYEDCRVARDKRLAVYRAGLAPPIKGGPGWVQGGLPGASAASTQFHLLTCEAKRVQ